MTDQVRAAETAVDGTNDRAVVDNTGDAGSAGSEAVGHERPTAEDYRAVAAAFAEPDDDAAAVDPEARESPNSEAAKWRRRLRDTESERDGLRATVERLQRREVERVAGERLSVPGDLFDVAKVTLENMLDDSGEVDVGKVEAAVKELLRTRPGLSRDARLPVDLGQGRRPMPSAGTTWGDVLRGS